MNANTRSKKSLDQKHTRSNVPSVDHMIRNQHKSKRQRTDEGLQLSRAFMQKYHYTSLPRNVIALWCQCSGENIRLIEERALRKLRRYNVFKREDLDWLCRIASRHYKREL